MSDDNILRELFPSPERIAIGDSDPRGTNTVERYQNAIIRYGRQSFGIYIHISFSHTFSHTPARFVSSRNKLYVQQSWNI